MCTQIVYLKIQANKTAYAKKYASHTCLDLQGTHRLRWDGGRGYQDSGVNLSERVSYAQA